MALSIPINPRSLFGALAVAVLVATGHPAPAAGIAREPIVWDSESTEFGSESGDDSSEVLVLKKPVVRQGSTLLTAANATARGMVQNAGNSTWDFTGNVHLEFDGAVLDAHAATAVFADGLLSSVVVQASGTQQRQPVRVQIEDATLEVDSASVAFSGGRVATVQARGGPARFTHLLKNNNRRAQGRAQRIDYDASRNLLTLTKDTWISVGNAAVESQEVIYNLEEGRYRSPGKNTGTYDDSRDGAADQPADHVPAPRTPDRATAK